MENVHEIVIRSKSVREAQNQVSDLVYGLQFMPSRVTKDYGEITKTYYPMIEIANELNRNDFFRGTYIH